MAFQHVPTLQSTDRLLLTPPSTWFSRMLACAYFALTTIGAACPTTWRPPNRGEIICCFRCALCAIWDLPSPLPAASFRSACRTVVILCLRVCLVCVFLLSITTDSARLFRSGDLTLPISYVWGSFSVSPPFDHRRFRLNPFIQAVESWLHCDSSCVCALLTPTKKLMIW